jgi:hypothetical protein
MISTGLVSLLTEEYETVMMPDGKLIQRERLTDAQIKMQVLKAKKRDKRLRGHLEKMIQNTDKDSAPKVPGGSAYSTTIPIDNQIKLFNKTVSLSENSSNDSVCLDEHNSQVNNSNEISAIEKQLILASKITQEKNIINTPTEEPSSKWSIFRALRRK